MIYNHLGQLPAFAKLRDSALHTLCGIVRYKQLYQVYDVFVVVFAFVIVFASVFSYVFVSIFAIQPFTLFEALSGTQFKHH